MWHWIKTLDRILRGEATSIEQLKTGDIDFPAWGLCVVIDMLGLLYGLCMGVFGLAHDRHAGLQTLSCMLKVPALFFLTLLVTFPSLYVFNAMVGSRLTMQSMLRLLVASIAVMMAVMASIGPIVAFFSFTTTSYSFMVLLNVLVCGIAGCLGMAFLLQSLHRLTVVLQLKALEAQAVDPAPVAAIDAGLSTAVMADPFAAVDPNAAEVEYEIADDPTPKQKQLRKMVHQWQSKLADEAAAPLAAAGPLAAGPSHPLGRHVRTIFNIWVLVFGLVGTQMAWVLSPFIGHPHQPFMLFHPTGSNFFQGVWNNLMALTAK